MEEIRLGTIGSGVIVHSVLDGVARTEGIRLAAVYSRSEERGKALAEKYDCEKVYTDMDAFMQDDEVNTIYVATPNLLHYQQTKAALLAGKHVICEKPFCTKSEQAQELSALAREKHLILVEAAPTTFLPNFQVLQRELPNIGRIKLVLANYSQYSSRYDKLVQGEIPNIFNPELAGGCLMDINFYNVYLTIALFGKPKEAIYYPNMFQNLIDTSGVVMMQYDGFVCQCAGAKDAWGVNSYQIEGEQGCIYITNGSNGLAEIRVVTKDAEACFNEQSDPNRWYYEVQSLTRLMLREDYDSLYQRLEIMKNVVETIEAVRKKAGIRFPGDNV